MPRSTNPSPDDLLVGQIFAGRFRIESLLGAGGMGSVYLATHEVLQRRFALKVIRPELLEDEQVAARFRREARAASRIEHPNIVRIFDFGHAEDGRPYIAMEHIEGWTLAELNEQCRGLPVQRALGILAQITDALHAAHAVGVIHRDLKPANVLLARTSNVEDVVKILDFGLAKVHESSATAGLSTAGRVFGTPEYMPPERCIDGTSDARSDLYSLGIMAFELLVGEVPFTGKVVQTLSAHMSQPAPRPSAASGRKDIPPGLDALVLRCLAKRPEDRYPTAKDLLEAIHHLRSKGGGPATTLPLPMPQPRRNEAPVEPDDTVALDPDDLIELPSGPPAAHSKAAKAAAPRFPQRGRSDTLLDLGGPVGQRNLPPRFMALEDAAYAVRDRGMGSPSISEKLGQLTHALDDQLEGQSLVDRLLTEEKALRASASARESHLTQALGQLEQELVLLGKKEPKAAERLRQRVQSLADRIKAIEKERGRRCDAIKASLVRLTERMGHHQPVVERCASELRDALTRLRPLLADSTEPELCDLFEKAGI